MMRFALIVTAIEIALTLGASFCVTLGESAAEPYLTPDDLRSLGMRTESYSTNARTRFGAIFSYDTDAVLSDSKEVAYVSIRADAQPVEFDGRRGTERANQARANPGEILILEDPWPGESGYAVRDRRRSGARSELVRLRGKEMLIVRVIRLDVPTWKLGEQASRCERLARIIQDHLMRKMFWRE